VSANRALATFHETRRPGLTTGDAARAIEKTGARGVSVAPPAPGMS